MKHIVVTLEISTKKHSIQELSRILGSEANDFSYSIGDIRGGRVSEYTVWKLESRISKTADLTEHLNNIQSIVSKKRILDAGKLPANCSILLNIGVFYYTAYCSITIPPDHWKWMDMNNISLEINCYPCSDGSDDL